MDSPKERIVGMVLVRSAPVEGMQPFMADLAQGIEQAFANHACSLLVRLITDPAAEVSIWRDWAEQRLVDGIIMVDHRESDDRVDVARTLGVPVVLLGGESVDLPITQVFVDNGEGARAAADELLEQGHRHIARVGGPVELLHTKTRDAAFLASGRKRGATVSLRHGDFSERSGRLMTRELLLLDNVPTGILYDNDLMAIGGIEAARELGMNVPRDLSVIAWDDTANARLATPSLSVVTIDVHALGRVLGEAVLHSMDGHPEPLRYAVPRPTVRRAQSSSHAERAE